MAMRESTSAPEGDEKFTPPDYTRPVDFHALAEINKDFRDCLASNGGRFSFKDADHLRCLTKASLLRDFKVQLFLPANRLCPPVPIRWLYVQWIKDLIDSTSPQLHRQQLVRGLDIGIGASCVYPLMACASRPKWQMYGTDIDSTNFQYALHNVAANDLDGRIKLLRTQPDDPLIPLDALGVDRLAFTMCNPPFFASKEEATATFSKNQQPYAACTGADVEMITPGGEVAFVSRMIDESMILREKVQWYTVQLGKLSSLHELIPRLRAHGCSNWVVHALQPSGQTVRWALGWSWMPYRAPDGLARHSSMVGTGLQLEPNEMSIDVPPKYTVEDVQNVIEHEMKTLPLRLDVLHANSEDMASYVVGTDTAVWSRSERRKRKREGAPEGGDRTTAVEASSQVKLVEEYGYMFTLHTSYHNSAAGEHVRLNGRWMKGEQRACFESFCGMLKTKMTATS